MTAREWMKGAGALGLGWVLAGCSTPGLSYTARVPAGDLEAASHRAVSVGRFNGPEGRWYTDRFEQMLLSADLDGAPWFIVHDPMAPEGTYSARYSGWVDIDDIRVDEYTKVKKKCVEWDGLFDCEHRAEVLQACIDVDVDVSVTARLTEVTGGAIVFQDTYSGSAGEHECDDVAIISGKYAERKRRGHGRFGRFHDRFGDASGYLTQSLVHDALRDTLRDVRRDVAPFNTRARAPLVAQAIDPEVRADPRFAMAISAAEDSNLNGSCSLWTSLLQAYPSAPGVRHNAGACAEATGDLRTAQGHYAEAVAQMTAYGQSGEVFEQLIGALDRIANVRTGDAILSDLIDPGRRPVPQVSDGVGETTRTPGT